MRQPFFFWLGSNKWDEWPIAQRWPDEAMSLIRNIDFYSDAKIIANGQEYR
jgi:hypothetical protein